MASNPPMLSFTTTTPVERKAARKAVRQAAREAVATPLGVYRPEVSIEDITYARLRDATGRPR